MDKKKVIDTLNIIAEDEIPGNVDLWPALHTRLGTSTAQVKSYVRWPTIRLGWAGLTIIILLLFSSVAYAISPVLRQLFINTDPGLQHVEETNLVQPLHLSQTIDGLIVTIEQAYADANRVAVGFTFVDPEGRRFDLQNIRLTYLPDTELPPMGAGGSGDGRYHLNFDASAVQDAPRQLDLQFVVYAEEWFYTPEIIELVKKYGSHEAIPDDKIPRKIVGGIGDKTGPFVFNFTIPFLPSQTLSIQQTVEAGNIQVRLEEVSITPSESQATVCVTPPVEDDTFTEWIPIANLDAGQEDTVSNGGSYTLSQTEQEFCHRLIFPYSLADQPGQWTVTITEVVGFSNEDYNKQMRLSGPWVFQFDVP